MAIVGRKGHVGTFDWQTGTLHAELQLKETCRDITFVVPPVSLLYIQSVLLLSRRFLHDQSHFAVAQKKYVFIYDQNGVELHRLSSHFEPTALEFLPYHWLLASVVKDYVLHCPYRPHVTYLGSHRISQVPGHVNRADRSGAPYKIRRVRDDVPECT